MPDQPMTDYERVKAERDDCKDRYEAECIAHRFTVCFFIIVVIVMSVFHYLTVYGGTP